MEVKTKFNIGDVVYFIRDNRIDEKLTEDPFMFNGKLFESITESKVQSISIRLFELSSSSKSPSIHQSVDYYLKGDYLKDGKSLFFSREEAEKYLKQEQMKHIEILQNKINNFKKRK
jgi:hypothetical protein